MSRWKAEGIVLRVVEVGDSDRVVHLLTPDRGRLAAIAKGARRSKKRFPGTLDVFNRVRFQAEQRRAQSLARLDQAVLLDAFLGLREDAARYALASYWIELLDRLAPEGGAPADLSGLYAFAFQVLSGLEGARADAHQRLWLELRGLDALGLRPELSRCVRCGRPLGDASRLGFHVGEGGVVGPGCAAGVDGLLPVHRGTLRALQRGLEFGPDQLARLRLSPAALAEASQLVRRFLRFHVGIELRSEPLLDPLCGPPPALSGTRPATP